MSSFCFNKIRSFSISPIASCARTRLGKGRSNIWKYKALLWSMWNLFWISFGPTCHALIQGECWALPISRPFLDRRGGIPQPPKLSIFTLALLPPLVFLFESVFNAHSSLAIGAMDGVLLVLKFSAAAVLSARFLLFCVFRFVCFVFCCFCFLLYYRFCIDSLWGLSF